VTSSGNPGPRSGDDTFDLIDDALATLAARRGVWLGDDLAAMTLVASLIEQAERSSAALRARRPRQRPHLARDRPRALGTSPDNAQLRFDPDSPSRTAAGLTTPDQGGQPVVPSPG
jgi:hypothetical protein